MEQETRQPDNDLVRTLEALDEQMRLQQIVTVKELRRDLDEILQRIKKSNGRNEEWEATKKVTEGIMWLGMSLKRLGAENPYPNSKNPDNTIVEPTADNLKL